LRRGRAASDAVRPQASRSDRCQHGCQSLTFTRRRSRGHLAAVTPVVRDVMVKALVFVAIAVTALALASLNAG